MSRREKLLEVARGWDPAQIVSYETVHGRLNEAHSVTLDGYLQDGRVGEPLLYFCNEEGDWTILAEGAVLLEAACFYYEDIEEVSAFCDEDEREAYVVWAGKWDCLYIRCRGEWTRLPCGPSPSMYALWELVRTAL